MNGSVGMDTAGYPETYPSLRGRGAHVTGGSSGVGAQQRGRGSSVDIGSISSRIESSGSAAHATLKPASAGLTRSLARELGAHRIHINHVAPGSVLTERQHRRKPVPARRADAGRRGRDVPFPRGRRQPHDHRAGLRRRRGTGVKP